MDVSVSFVNSFNFRFTGFYRNPKSDLRSHSCDLLRLFHSLSNLSCLVAGDFNDILFINEKTGQDWNT